MNQKYSKTQVHYWQLMSNILKTNKRKMRVKEITNFVSRFHPYFAKMNQTNLGCALRSVLNKRSDLFAKHTSMKGQYSYSLVGHDEDDDDDDEAENKEKKEEEDKASTLKKEIGAKYIGVIKEAMVSLDGSAVSVKDICEYILNVDPSFRNRDKKYFKSSIRKVLELRNDLFERFEGENSHGVKYSLRCDMMDVDVKCQKCGSGMLLFERCFVK